MNGTVLPVVVYYLLDPRYTTLILQKLVQLLGQLIVALHYNGFLSYLCPQNLL